MERWDRWMAKGAEHDRRTSTKVRYVTVFVITGLLVALAFVTTMQ